MILRLVALPHERGHSSYFSLRVRQRREVIERATLLRVEAERSATVRRQEAIRLLDDAAARARSKLDALLAVSEAEYHFGRLMLVAFRPLPLRLVFTCFGIANSGVDWPLVEREAAASVCCTHTLP